MNSKDKLKWDLKRFGFWPPKRIFPSAELKPVLINSIPKSGTHLLESLLCNNGPFYRPMLPTFNPRLHSVQQLISAIKTLKKNQMVFSHFPYSNELASAIAESGVNFVFVIRDPRDVVVSNAHFIPTLTKHVHYQALHELPFEQRLDILIKGSDSLKVESVFDKTTPFAPWTNELGITVRFENLSRNAEADTKLQETSRLLQFIGLNTDATTIHSEGKSTTFRKGLSGDWTNHLTQEQISCFESSELLTKLGYN